MEKQNIYQKMDLQEIVQKLNKQFNPLSIVLYGSRARTDFLERSDYEIGALFPQDRFFSWHDIKQVVNIKGFNVYPFVYENFLKGKIDTPFQKRIYLRELVVAGKTISGENIIGKMQTPTIRINDLIEDIRFNSGYALGSIISYRNNDGKSSSIKFSKSCLFATRALVMLQLSEFPYTYDDILKLSRKLDLKEHKKLVEKAYYIRQGNQSFEEKDLIQNITYINYFIEPQLVEAYEKDKEAVVIP